MGLWDKMKSWSKKNKSYSHANMLNGYLPIFQQFGTDIYASDVVQNCIDVIASEMSKLQPKHIRTDNQGLQTIPNGNLNRLFKFAPNEWMTTKDFIEKIIWLLYLHYNAFIYPTYVTTTDAQGFTRHTYTGLYPLQPTQVEFLQDENNNLFIHMTFMNGNTFTLPYADVIHIRKKFSLNEMMGGGMRGQPDQAALLKVLQINETVLQGLEKGIQTSLCIRGIVNIKTMMDDEMQRQERKRFERALQEGSSGIMALDLKGEYIPIKPDPKLIDKETLDFLQNKILNWFGVSLPLLTSDYSDEQYQAFYEKTLEPMIISFGQAFSKVLFTDRELDVGNEIVFYPKDMMYLSTKAKLDLLKIAGEQGLLTDNQKLALLGYPPIEGGDKRTMSLNYIDVNLANAYQMQRKPVPERGGDNDE